MNRAREVGFFLLCSVLICLAVSRSAFWGSRILAPLDIAPTIFSKYRYVDPTAGNIPANHYVIDQLTFDLPLQYTIYHAYRHGEIPWWDPYTYGGRPLLADAHVNGTDPIRLLCYLTLPFVNAYNWNLILKSILTGLGMFVLLRHLPFPFSISLPLALTYQFAGCFAIFFSHPWIQASFAYYPFLWVAWSVWLQRNSLRYLGISALLCALILYSGNLQSHAYLPFYALCFLVGHSFGDRKLLLRLCLAIALSSLAGVALAAPVVWPQIEFYLNSLRTAAFSPSSPFSYLAGIGSFSVVFPWLFGTFRALDLGKFTGNNALGFVIYIGSAGIVLALIGAWKGAEILPEQNGARRTAIGLILLYFGVCSTPLLPILYTRMAPIAVIGLTILAAFGLSALRERSFPRVSWAIVATASLLVIGLNVAAFVVYPRCIGYVQSFVAARDKTNSGFTETTALRSFQVRNLPHEISVQNPESIFAFVSLLALAIYLRQPRAKAFGQAALLTLNFLPLIFFFSRYVANQPIAYWEKLLDGGPEQRLVAQTLNPKHLRLLEESPSLNDMLFPNNMGHLEQMHTVHGLSALQPASLFHWPSNQPPPPPEFVADFIYRSDPRGQEAGQLARMAGSGQSRLRCGEREMSITEETLNTLTVSVAPGPASKLLRSDTWYPGWRAWLNGTWIPLDYAARPFSTIELPGSDTISTVSYTYRPSYSAATGSIAMITGVFLLGVISLGKRQHAKVG